MRWLVSLFRDLIVLACLVTIPLLAVFGNSLPETLASFLPGHEATKPVSAEKNEKEAKSGTFGANPSVKINNSPLVKPGDLGAKPTGIGSTSFQDANSSSMGSMAGLGNQGVASNSDALNVPARDSFAPLESRLQQLGARFYRLETSGTQGESFRFHCEMPSAGTATPAFFEAVDSDPIKAVARVIHQVEDARFGRTN